MCSGFHSISATLRIAWAANLGIATVTKTSQPAAFRSTICEVDGRVGGLVGLLGLDHRRRLVAEPVLEPLQIVLAEIVVLIEHADLAVGLVLQDVGGIDAPFRSGSWLPAHRPGMALGVVPFGGAGASEQLRHLLLVHVVPDRAVGRRAERAGR